MWWIWLAVAALLLAVHSAHARDIALGTFPSNASEKVGKALAPLAEYLSEQTGDNVRLIISSDYDELLRRLEDGSVDLAWIGATGYVRAREMQPNLRYLATYQEWEKTGKTAIPYYRSYIVTRKDSSLVDLASMRGTRFAFTDKGSTSGYTYPVFMFSAQGIFPERYFGKMFFLRRQDKVVEALVAGSIDAGAMSDGAYENGVRKYGDVFRILFRSEEIPLDAIVASPNMEEETSLRYQAALTSLPKDSPVLLAISEHLGWPAAGFVVKNDAFYDPLRRALNYVELE